MRRTSSLTMEATTSADDSTGTLTGCESGALGLQTSTDGLSTTVRSPPAIRPILDALDHRLLNDLPGLENPTTEILAPWLYERLKPSLPLLTSIEIAESATTGCVFER